MQKQYIELTLALHREYLPAKAWGSFLSHCREIASGAHIVVLANLASQKYQVDGALGLVPVTLALPRQNAPAQADETILVAVRHEADLALLELEFHAKRETCSADDWQRLVDEVREQEGTLKCVLRAQLLRLAEQPRQRSSAGLLECIQRPAMLINGERRITLANGAGRGLIEDGRYLSVNAAKQFDLNDAVANRQFIKAVGRLGSAAEAADNVHIVRFQCGDGFGHHVKLQPLSGAQGQPCGLPAPLLEHLVTFHMSNVPLRISPDVLQQFFDLTPACANLVAALAGGRSLVDYCADANLTVAGGRYHVHQALQRMECANQPEMIARVLNSIV